MSNHDIIALKQYEDKIDLYCNCYNYGFETLEYFSTNISEIKIQSIQLQSPYITVKNLDKGKIVFYGVNYNKERSTPLFVDIFCESKDEYFEKIIYEKNDKHDKVINKIKDEDYLIALYKLFMQSKNEEEQETCREILNYIVDNLNNMCQQMNCIDNIIIKPVKKHVLYLNLINDPYLDAEYIIDIEKLTFEKEYLKKDEGSAWIYEGNFILDKKTKYIIPRLALGIYKIGIFIKSRLIRSYYFYCDDDSRNMFEQTMAQIEKEKNKKLNTSMILSSEYEFEDEEEKEVILTIESVTSLSAVIQDIDISYKDAKIILDVSKYYDFLTKFNTNIYLAAKEQDTVYNDNVTPHRTKITGPIIEFDPINEYFYNNERYYFYIEVSNKKLSRIKTFDISEKDAKDYNDKYQRILWNRYCKNLYKVFNNNKNRYWPQIKEILDRYLVNENISNINIKEYLLEQLLMYEKNYENLAQIIYLIEYCDLKYYTQLNRNFMKHQLYKSAYNLHVVPEGNYILEITRINNGSITKEYISEPSKVHEIRTNADKYIVFKCIDIDTLKSSDFCMYNNSGTGRKSYYNELEVEVLNGL